MLHFARRLLEYRIKAHISLHHSYLRKSLAVLAAALLLSAVGISDGPNTVQAGPSIDVGNFWFCEPSFQSGVCETTIPSGSAVTWTWVGLASHNVKECGADFSKGLLCTGGGGPDWASATQTSGTFVRAFDTEGEFFYRCTVHPTLMRGKLIVSGQAVGGVAQLPESTDASELVEQAGRGNFPLVWSIVAAALASMAVFCGAWLMLRRRA